jgi:hypothetical protein
MQSLKAIYEDGHVRFPEHREPKGRINVIITFLEEDGVPSDKAMNAGKRFVEKWAGVIEGRDLEKWRESRTEYLRGKHA